jgi:hypothetical protein
MIGVRRAGARPKNRGLAMAARLDRVAAGLAAEFAGHLAAQTEHKKHYRTLGRR